MSTVEPRTVRAVMKRLVEDVTVIDDQVGQLYQEGQKKVTNTNSTILDSSLASNIQKLFSEKMDYFAPVTNSKVRMFDIFRTQMLIA